MSAIETATTSSPDLSSPPSRNTPPPNGLSLNPDLHAVAPKRRKKDAPPNAGPESKPKRPRIPRGTGPRAMKKKEMEAKRAAAELAGVDQNANLNPPLPPPQPAGNIPRIATPPNFQDYPAQIAQNGNREAIHTLTPKSQAQPARPSSGQNYDPIRSTTITSRPSTPHNVMSTPPKPILSATHSPAISSLIDPPEIIKPRVFAPTDADEHQNKRPRLSPAPESSLKSNLTTVDDPNASTASAKNAATSKSTLLSKNHSPNDSPKPTTNSNKSAPLPTTGSGLLNGSIFGAGSMDDSAPHQAPTVVLQIALGDGNHHINFTKLAEEKYGFDALYPRLAAQRDRRARVAAAGAALERVQKGVSDDLSEDLSNDDADNSNVEAGGAPDAKSGEDGDKPKKKRVMKEDMYDIDDDFIDDTEQAWEEQALASMDGFFVYSGPLVPDGEEPKVESRSTEAQPKRGRGGRGTRGGGAATGRGRAGNSGAAKDKEEKDTKRRVRRSKEQMEKDRKELEEKKQQQKEKLTVLASKPAASAASTTNTALATSSTTATTAVASHPGQMQFQAQPQLTT